MVSSGNMGRRKRDGNHSPPKNKVVQYLERNEENGYPEPDSTKQRSTIPRNPMKTTRTPWKKKFYK
jgi:hypothetical protein